MRVKVAIVSNLGYRVNYQERQPLTVADLNDEQAYRIALRRQHRLAAHGWGIVRGLGLEVIDNNLAINPGIAIDGFGRELRVGETLRVDKTTLDELVKDSSKDIDVWLLYACVPITTQQQGRWSSSNHNRWREETRVRLTSGVKVDPRKPPGVSEEYLSSGLFKQSPDKDMPEWPVYLGRIKKAGDYTVEEVHLAYTTLVGNRITAASHSVQMHIDRQQGQNIRQLAISFPDEKGDFTDDRLVIDNQGQVKIYGDTKMLACKDEQGNEVFSKLTFLNPSPEGGNNERALGIDFRPLKQVPEQAAPWQVYRVDEANNGNDDENSANGKKQLRFEIPNPGEEGDPAGNALVIGARAEEGKEDFEPCLTVDASSTVTVNTLKIKGQLIESPISANIDDPQFVDLITRQLAQDEEENKRSDLLDIKLKSTKLESPTNDVKEATYNFRVEVESFSKESINRILIFAHVFDAAERRIRLITLLEDGLKLGAEEILETVEEKSLKLTESSLLVVTAIGVEASANVVQAFVAKQINVPKEG